MKVLTATREKQGRRNNDFSWTVDGELVFFPPLDCSRGSVDDDCGCRRAMAGMVSHRATTTIKVIDRQDLDPDSYLDLVADGLKSQGYVTDELLRSSEVREWVADTARELMAMADFFEEGSVVERRGDTIQVRP